MQKINNLSLEQKEQIKKFKNNYVIYSINKPIIEVIHQILENKSIGSEQYSMLLTGDAGAGKTALATYIRDKYNDESNPYKILFTRVPSKLSVQHLIREMLSQLESLQSKSILKKESDKALTERLIAYIKELDVQLIIINEFQELLEFKSIGEQQAIANTLKLISEEAQVPFLFVGMPWSEKITDDSQWSSRLAYKAELPYFKLSDDDSMSVYLEFLHELSKTLPFDIELDLTEEIYAFPLFSISKGETRIIKRLITEAIICMCHAGENTLNIEHFKQAYRRFDNSSKKNLFELPIDDIPISEIDCYARYEKNDDGNFDKFDRKFLDSLPLSQIL